MCSEWTRQSVVCTLCMIVHVEVHVQTVKEQHGLEGTHSYLSAVRTPYKA